MALEAIPNVRFSEPIGRLRDQPQEQAEELARTVGEAVTGTACPMQSSANGRTPEAAYPAVTEDLLDEIVKRICQAGSPEKIVLFGSHARGSARPDSDLDLLIIEESDLPRYRRSVRYYHALAGLFPAKDILVYTPAEVEHWAAVPNALVTTALREGRVLYGRPG